MVVSVINTYHWTPSYINRMYVDSLDYMGIEFWYNEVKKQHDSLESPKKKS